MTEIPAQHQSSTPDQRTGILLGLLADTHGVYDPVSVAVAAWATQLPSGHTGA